MTFLLILGVWFVLAILVAPLTIRLLRSSRHTDDGSGA